MLCFANGCYVTFLYNGWGFTQATYSAAGTLTINNGTGTGLIINGTFEDNGPNIIGW